MQYLARYGAAHAAALGLVLAAIAASAASVVEVELWDEGQDRAMSTGITYATPGLDRSKASMGMRLSRSTVPAGEVTFNVTSSSKDMEHEMVVVPLKDPTKPLPYVASESRVDEDEAGDVGEVSELEPGYSGSLTVSLEPGSYLLVCNVPGHYAAGMWAELEVTK